MIQASVDDRYERCHKALRHHVCAVCLDSRDDGSCDLAGRRCALDVQLPRLVDVLRRVHSGRMDEYAEALQAEICSRCEEEDASGACRLRDHGECALATYLPIVVDAIEESGA